MTTYAELWAAVYQRKSEHAEDKPLTMPNWHRCEFCAAIPGEPCNRPPEEQAECPYQA